MWRDSASKSFSGKKRRGEREDRRKKSIGVIRVLFSVLFSLYHQRTINPLNSARPGHVRKTTEGGGWGKKGAITLPHYHLMDAVFCSPSGAIDNHRDTRPYLRARPFSYFLCFFFFPFFPFIPLFLGIGI